MSETGDHHEKKKKEEGEEKLGSSSSSSSSSSTSSCNKNQLSTKTVVDFIIWFCKDQWFLIGTGIVTAIASQVQVPAQQQAVKQVVVSYLAISIVFFVTGCTLETKILIDNYAKWRQHLFVQTGCFLLVSALAFGVVSLAATNHHSFMDPWFLIGLIFNGVQPTAMASNVMFTRQANGNAVLTVVETTIGNFIGPFITPVLVKMYLSSGAWYTKVVPLQSGGYGALYARVFKQFGLSIYLPLLVGQMVRFFFPKVVHKVFVDMKLGKFASVCMLAILWQTFDHAFATGAFQTAKPSNLVFIVFITIVNYFLWLVITVLLSVIWFDRKDTVAIAMCIPAKTLALGLPLSFLVFTDITALDEARIQVPLVIFQIIQMGFASLCTIGFRRWVDADEKKQQKKKEDKKTEREDQEVLATPSTTGGKEEVGKGQQIVLARANNAV